MRELSKLFCVFDSSFVYRTEIPPGLRRQDDNLPVGGDLAVNLLPPLKNLLSAELSCMSSSSSLRVADWKRIPSGLDSNVVNKILLDSKIFHEFVFCFHSLLPRFQCERFATDGRKLCEVVPRKMDLSWKIILCIKYLQKFHEYGNIKRISEVGFYFWPSLKLNDSLQLFICLLLFLFYFIYFFGAEICPTQTEPEFHGQN